MTASRDVNDLHPDLQPIYLHFESETEKQKLEYILTCTYRSITDQNILYAMGRTTRSYVGPWTNDHPLGRVVTNARGGNSAHNFMIKNAEGILIPAAKAFDIVPAIHGKPIWDQYNPLWQKLGDIGTNLGLNWYGRPDAPFREFPHFQLST